MRLTKLCITAVFSLLLAACASFGPGDWPPEIPERDQFVAAWEADAANQSLQSREEYLYWVRNFYTGTVIYPRGWLSIEEELLSRAAPAELPELTAELERLGIRIGAEWAKENSRRVVNNRLLALWGSVLQIAQLDRRELEAVDLIAADVRSLFDGSLQRSDISEARYAEQLDYEVFGDF